MHWFQEHPYVTGLFAACLLLLVGIVVVSQHASIGTSVAQTNAWGGTTTINPLPYGPSQPTQTQPSANQTIMQQVQSGPPFTYTPPQALQTSTTTDVAAITSQDNSFNYDSFIASLAQESAAAPQQANTTGQGSTSTLNVYAFIPSGLISTSTSVHKRSAVQQALYDYGNNVGSYIQSFETQNPNEAQVLKDQAADPGNPDKNAALTALGNNLSDLGQNLLNIGEIPTGVAAENTALGKSYEEIGANLALVPQAQGDSSIVNAMETYDASADRFTKNYVALANTFAAYGVVFTPDDPGSAFTFTPTSL